MRLTIFSVLVNFAGTRIVRCWRILSACTFDNSVGSVVSVVSKISWFSLSVFSFGRIRFKNENWAPVCWTLGSFRICEEYGCSFINWFLGIKISSSAVDIVKLKRMKQNLIMSWISSKSVFVSKSARRLSTDDFFLRTPLNMCLKVSKLSKSLTFTLTWPSETLWRHSHKTSLTSLSQLRKYFLNFLAANAPFASV